MCMYIYIYIYVVERETYFFITVIYIIYILHTVQSICDSFLSLVDCWDIIGTSRVALR